MSKPTEYEIRLAALTLAVQGSKARPSGATLSVAEEFADYLRQGLDPEPVTLSGPVPLRFAVETTGIPIVLGVAETTELHERIAEDDAGSALGVWGPQCRRCLHSAGMHGRGGCHHVEGSGLGAEYCRCPLTEHDVNVWVRGTS